MQKRTLIKMIKAIIEEFGSFNINDVENETICIGERGGLTDEADYFGTDDVVIKVYRPAGVSSDPITHYRMTYEEFKKEYLVEILRVAENYAVDMNKAYKRSLS